MVIIVFRHKVQVIDQPHRLRQARMQQRARKRRRLERFDPVAIAQSGIL